MKKYLILLFFPCLFGFTSVEDGLNKASSLENWNQQLKNKTQQLAEYEQQLQERAHTLQKYLDSEQGRQAQNRQALQQELESLTEKQAEITRAWQILEEKNQTLNTREQQFAWRERMYQYSQNQAVQATQDALREQAFQDRPQPITKSFDAGMTTVEPRQITMLPDGNLGLSDARVHQTIVLPVLPTQQPVEEKQNSRAQFTIDNIESIEIKAILQQDLTDIHQKTIDGIVKTGEVVAEKRIEYERYKTDKETWLAWYRELKSLLIWLMVLALPAGWLFNKIAKEWRHTTVEVEAKKIENAYKADKYIDQK